MKKIVFSALLLSVLVLGISAIPVTVTPFDLVHEFDRVVNRMKRGDISTLSLDYVKFTRAYSILDSDPAADFWEPGTIVFELETDPNYELGIYLLFQDQVVAKTCLDALNAEKSILAVSITDVLATRTKARRLSWGSLHAAATLSAGPEVSIKVIRSNGSFFELVPPKEQ